MTPSFDPDAVLAPPNSVCSTKLRSIKQWACLVDMSPYRGRNSIPCSSSSAISSSVLLYNIMMSGVASASATLH
jgi:hypothetical protein